MVQAPVGWQCRRCVAEWSRVDRGARYRPRAAGMLGHTTMTPITVVLIVVNVVVFVLTGFGTGPSVVRFASEPDLIHQGQVYRLLTSAFLHANFAHILLNMATLAIIGPPVEVLLGRVRFVGLYLLAALGGSVCSYLLSPADVYGLGASGAIFGLLGAYFVLARQRRMDTGTIIALIVVNLVYGFAVPGIDWRAHIGGLVVGAVVALAFSSSQRWRPPRRAVADVVAAALTLAVLASLLQLPPGHVNL